MEINVHNFWKQIFMGFLWRSIQEIHKNESRLFSNFSDKPKFDSNNTKDMRLHMRFSFVENSIQ